MTTFTRLLMCVVLLFAVITANAQVLKPKKYISKNAISVLLAKERVAKYGNTAKRAKNETQKKIATYVYIDRDDNGQLRDTGEKFTFTWGANGLPTQVLMQGVEDDIIDGQSIPYRVIFSNFVKINEAAEGELDWFVGTSGFDAKDGLFQIYVGNTWVNYAKVVKTINAQGFATEMLEQRWLIGTWTDYAKDIYTHNSQGKLTEIVRQERKNNQWVNSLRYLDMYDDEGRNFGSQEDEWVNNAWVTNYGGKTIYTKDNTNKIISAERQMFDQQNGNWVPLQKQEFEWINNQITKVTEQHYNDGSWRTSMEYRNIVWKSFDPLSTNAYPVMIGGENFQSLDVYNYDDFNNEWRLVNRNRNIFTGNNMTESIFETWTGSEWDTSSRTMRTFYSNGDEKEIRYMYKDNNEWKVQYGYGYNNTYDNDGDITRRAGLEWDSENNMFVEEDLELYTYTTINVGISDNDAKSAIVKLYPNPVTSGNVTVELPANVKAAAYVTVYDNTGRMVLNTVNSADKNYLTLNTGNLPKGLYIVNINQAGKLAKAQFIIQ